MPDSVAEKARKFARRSGSAGSGCCRRMAAVPYSDFALRNCEAFGTIERCRTFDEAASSEANPERHGRAERLRLGRAASGENGRSFLEQRIDPGAHQRTHPDAQHDVEWSL